MIRPEEKEKIGGPSWSDEVLDKTARLDPRARLKEAQAEFQIGRSRRKGWKLGRPQGATVSDKELLSKHADIVRRLKEGHSVRNTARITGNGGSTVQRVKAALVA